MFHGHTFEKLRRKIVWSRPCPLKQPLFCSRHNTCCVIFHKRLIKSPVYSLWEYHCCRKLFSKYLNENQIKTMEDNKQTDIAALLVELHWIRLYNCVTANWYVYNSIKQYRKNNIQLNFYHNNSGRNIYLINLLIALFVRWRNKYCYIRTYLLLLFS